MMKKFILLLSTVFFMGTAANAQDCGTDEMTKRMKLQYPEIETYEKTLNTQIENYLKAQHSGSGQNKNTAFGPNDTLHIPVVVHIVHDYSTGTYVADNKIYDLINYINKVYLAQTTNELVNVIPTFQPYIGSPKIQFHLASKDPLGQPTKGITHRWSYLTYGGDNQAKFDIWAPDSYINIWIIDHIGSSTPPNRTLAYATPPASAAAAPHYDGVIGEVQSSLQVGPGNDYTIPHELGHVLNLAHTWGSTNQPGVECGDDDVDDTPPTEGSFGCPLYDTTCIHREVPTSKVIIDSAARIVDSIDGAGIDFDVKTGITLKSVDIYPIMQGLGFDIALQDNNGATLKTFAAFEKVGDTAADLTVKSSSYNTQPRAGINFNVTNNARIETVTIYPTAIGQPFTIMLTWGNDTLATYNGTTTTNTGAQVVPVGFFVPKRNSYWIYVSNNPGLKHDIPSSTAYSAANSGIDFIIFKDSTTGINQGYYNYLYDWSVRYRGVTDTPKVVGGLNKTRPYTVPLDWTIYPGKYKLVLTENQGLSHDVDSTLNYPKTIQCVVALSNERTNNTYDYMYNWVIRYGYIKGNVAGDCFDYPDTTNVQNIMNYSNCKLMFSKGQSDRMRAALASTVGNRDKLVTIENAKKTGILNEATGKYGLRLDLPPVADFSVELYNNTRTYYMCADNVQKFRFKDRSWGDTVTKVTWEFSNNATPATKEGTAGDDPTVSFGQPGWVNVKLTATGNNSGDGTITRDAVVYAADPNFKISPLGYFQEFNQGADVDKWPSFNYYNNASKWEVINGNGFFDKTCIMYKGYDERGATSGVGSPGGDFDDFFSPAFDLSGLSGDASLNFMFAGAYRTTIPAYMRDTLEIHYSVNCGETWLLLKRFTKQELSTKGVVPVPYAPLYHGEWSQKSIDLPAGLKSSDRAFLRFRYKPGAGEDFLATGSGNNFYIDRININEFPAGINTLMPDDKNVIIAPNPTANNSFVIIRSNGNADAQVRVTDVTGKLIYATQQNLKDKLSRIEIPASVISVKGVYMVQVQTGDKTYNEKLVVY